MAYIMLLVITDRIRKSLEAWHLLSCPLQSEDISNLFYSVMVVARVFCVRGNFISHIKRKI
jgi:hypothetical protein